MKTTRSIKTCLTVILTAASIPAFAAPGKLDASFGTHGKVTTAIGTASDIGNSVAIQANGQIVVAGKSHNGTDWDFAVVRYLASGALDTTFGVSGKVVTPIGSGNDAGNGVAIQKDGKIVVVGETHNGNNFDFTAVRYNTNGTIDTSFGESGKVTTGFDYNEYGNVIPNLGDDYAYDVAIQSDGKIVIVGSVLYSQNGLGRGDDFGVIRINADGTLDQSFGKVVTDVYIGARGAIDVARSVGIQDDGKIIVAGDSYDSYTTSNLFSVARYNSDGTLDQDFGDMGTTTTRMGDSLHSVRCFARSIALQKDGKIVVAGQLLQSDYDFAVVRYDSHGSLDNSFNESGIVKTDFGNGDDDAFSAVLQTDGKIWRY